MVDPRILIITGAGASTSLGAGGEPLAMMGDWAASLVDELKYAADLIGLTKNMRGDEFEAALGRFIAFSEALSSIAPLNRFGQFETVITEPERALTKVDATVWMQLAEQNVHKVRMALHRNLYEQFGQKRIDDDKAKRAYSKLHGQIREAFADRDGPVFFAHVTTNFDHAIEAAIEQAEPGDYPQRVRSGFGRAVAGRREPWAPNLLAYSSTGDDEAPVVHLHGAIGWYFTEDGNEVFRRNTDDEIVPDFTPALLLPDDKKDTNRFPAPLRQVWEQFTHILRNSTHVLVLGHSLHDKHLVEALSESGKPVAVVLYTPTSGEDTVEPDQARQEFMKFLPGAVLIPGRFGSEEEGTPIERQQLREWLRENAVV